MPIQAVPQGHAPGALELLGSRAANDVLPVRAPVLAKRLLVIDDAQCAWRIAGVLPEHAVTTAPSTAAAIAAMRADRHDAVLCDLLLLVIAGDDLVAALAELAPSPPLIAMSQRSSTTFGTRWLKRLVGRVVWKPFDRIDLLGALALDAAP
jgi:DNA-binding response OmpR family regulator